MSLLLVVVALLVGLVLWKLVRRLVEPRTAPPLVYIDGSRWKPAKLARYDPVRLLLEAQKEYGNVFTIDYMFFRQTVIVDSGGMDFIYLNKDDTLSFYEHIKVFLRGMLGDESIRERPEAEHIERASKIATTLVKFKRQFFKCVQEEVEDWASELASKNEAFELYQAAENLITRVNIHCFIGKEMREKYTTKFATLYDELERKGPAARCAQIRKEITEILEPIIIERQRKFQESGHEQIDYLNEYITTPHKLTKEPWTLVEMVERTLSIFFAARVNTLRTFFWTAANIATHPEVIENLRERLPSEITLDGLKSVKYVDYCVKEAVRPLFNILPFARRVMKPVEYNGYIIPKGYVVGASAYFVNRDPRLFPNPERFCPERWESETKEMKTSWTFFGNGQHRCKGEDFAYLVLRTSLATIFKKYDLKLLDYKDGQIPPYNPQQGLPFPACPVMATLKKLEQAA